MANDPRRARAQRLRGLASAFALLGAVAVQEITMALVFAHWTMTSDTFGDVNRHFQPAWLLVVLIPEFLFVTTLVLLRQRSGAPLTRRDWLIAVAVLLAAGLLFPVTATITGYGIVNAFPR